VDLKVAKIGFAGVILGSIISVGGAWLNTFLQEYWDKDRHIKEKQASVISDMSDSLAYAGRVKGLIYGHMVQIVSANQINTICINGAIHGKLPNNCDMSEANKNMNEFSKEIFQKTAEFQSVRNLSNVYFCKNTQAALSQEPFASERWEATTKQTESLLKIMRSEYGCKNL
jgi:flagellar biosynthesis/type III secretory pathway chaperone